MTQLRLLILLACMLLFALPVYAQVSEASQKIQVNAQDVESVKDDESFPVPGEEGPFEEIPTGATSDEGGMFERVIATVVEVPIKVIKYIGNAAGMKPIDELVFLNGLSEDEKKLTPWTEKEIQFIKLWYAALAGIIMPFMLVIIIITGVKLTIAGVSPGLRAEAINSIWRWFGAVGITLVAPLLVQTILTLTNILLLGIQNAFILVSQEIGLDRMVGDWASIDGGYFDNIITGSVLGTSIVKAMLVFLFLWLNIIYLVRKLTLTVMLCFTPFMAIFWAANKNVNAAGVWLGEIASNAFMPVAHALVLCLVLGFCDVKNVSEGTWFTILVFMYTLMPIAEVLRNSLQSLFTRASGLNEAMTARNIMVSAVGLGSIMSLGRAGGALLGTGAAAGAAGMSIGGSSGGLAPVSVPTNGVVSGIGAPPTIYGNGLRRNSNQMANAPSSDGSTMHTIGFGAQDEPKSQPQAAPTKTPTHWAGYAMTAANVATGAFGGLMQVASGAVPGGYQVSKAMTSAAQGAARFTVGAGTVMGQTLYQRMTGQSNSIGQALRHVTNVKENGLKGTFIAAQRAGSIGLSAVKHGNLQQLQQYQGKAQQAETMQPKRVIGFRPPTRGLE